MSDICHELHLIANNLPRYNFLFDKKYIPANGIYLLFEVGETAHGNYDRIIRIGTHTGQNQLPSRLRQHFWNENKDRSIFRKNIGRAILNRDKDEYLSAWEIDLTTRDSRERFIHRIDKNKQKSIEGNITSILQQNFSFCVLKVEEKALRLDLESKIISTISSCKDCIPSVHWLGRFSTRPKIVNSGLWLVNELYKKCLDEKDIEIIKQCSHAA